MAGFNIPLEYKSPQFENGSDLLQRGLSIQNLATSTQINQQRLQEEKIKADEAAQDREDNNTIQNEFLNPAHLKPVKDDPEHRTMDWDSLRGSLQGKVRLRNLQKLDASHQEQVRAAQQMAATDKINQTSSLALKDAQNRAVGREIQGLEQLDDKDKPAYYAGALQRLQKQGIPTDDLPQTIPGDGSFNQQLTALAASHGYNGAIIGDELKRQRAEQAAAAAKRAEATARASADKDTADQSQRAREGAARIYLAADPQDQTGHAAAIAQITKKYPAIADEYANLKFDANKTADIIQQMAQTSQQRTTTGQKQQQLEEKASHDTEMARVATDRAETYRTLADVRQQLADLREAGGPGGGQTKNSAAITQRQARNEYYKLVANESKLNRLRGALGAMTKSDKPVTNKDGSPRDLKAEFEEATDELSQLLADKYDAATRAGMGEPSVPLEKALSAIGRGPGGTAPAPTTKTPPPAAPPQSPKQTAPPASPTSANRPAPGKSAKPFPRARLAAFAKANHVSEQDAESELKSQGYTVQ